MLARIRRAIAGPGLPFPHTAIAVDGRPTHRMIAVSR